MTPFYHELLKQKQDQGTNALRVMDDHLQARPFFVGGQYTIADIGLYAYTHVAHEGGFDLEPFPSVRLWLERVRGQPGAYRYGRVDGRMTGQRSWQPALAGRRLMPVRRADERALGSCFF